MKEAHKENKSRKIRVTYNASKSKSSKDRNDHQFNSPKTQDGCMNFLDKEKDTQVFKNKASKHIKSKPNV